MAIFNPNSSTMKFDMFVNEGESEPSAFRSAAVAARVSTGAPEPLA